VGTFLAHPPDLTIEDVQAAYMIFLKHVFDEIRKVLEKDFRRSALTYAALSTSWRTHLESEGTRPHLYKSIVDASKESYKQWPKSPKGKASEVRPYKPRQSSMTAFDRINLGNCQRA